MRANPAPVILSLGSNLGDRLRNLRAAVARLSEFISIARLSSVYSSAPIDAPRGSPEFLNLVLLGFTNLTPIELLELSLEIEQQLGRRRGARNTPRVIDIDVVLFGSSVIRTPQLMVPHPRYRERNFVLEPLRELRLDWIDPETGTPLDRIKGEGAVRRVGRLY